MKKVISCALNPDVIEEINNLAANTGLSRSFIVETALRNMLIETETINTDGYKLLLEPNNRKKGDF